MNIDGDLTRLVEIAIVPYILDLLHLDVYYIIIIGELTTLMYMYINKNTHVYKYLKSSKYTPQSISLSMYT